MRVRRGAEEIIAPDVPNALRVKHLRPGDVFRYKNGAERNVYLVLTDGAVLKLGGGYRLFYDNHPNAMVVRFPDAEVNLGEREEETVTTEEAVNSQVSANPRYPNWNDFDPYDYHGD